MIITALVQINVKYTYGIWEEFGNDQVARLN